MGIGGGAVRALAAGADLLCIGNPTNPGDAALPDQDEHDFHAARDAIVDALRDGSLSRDRVAEAGARVARLAARLRAERDGAGAPADYDAVAIVRRAVTVHDELGAPAAALAVLDARRRSSLAVDSAASYVSATLAEGGPVRRLDPERATAQERGQAIGDIAAAEAAGARVTVLVDRIDTDEHQRSLLAEVARAVPGTAVVNVGLPAATVPAALPVIEVRAASRVGASVARERLVGAAR